MPSLYDPPNAHRPALNVGLFGKLLHMIPFRNIDYTDRDLVLSHTMQSATRNCDFNFMNLVSWSFLYGTQIAVHRGLLVVSMAAPPICRPSVPNLTVTANIVKTMPRCSTISLPTPNRRGIPSG